MPHRLHSLEQPDGANHQIELWQDDTGLRRYTADGEPVIQVDEETFEVVLRGILLHRVLSKGWP